MIGWSVTRGLVVMSTVLSVYNVLASSEQNNNYDSSFIISYPHILKPIRDIYNLMQLDTSWNIYICKSYSNFDWLSQRLCH